MTEPSPDYLGDILERKRREVARRKRHLPAATTAQGPMIDRGTIAVERLRRRDAPLAHVIAEVKLRSPSAGQIRVREPGIVQSIARSYEAAGATAVSVLCDRVGFGGGMLDLRRARAALGIPLLFKEFVLDPVQVALARAAGADMVLLLVRALTARDLRQLCDEVRNEGMAPVVEAADEREVEVALTTSADIIGVNARDLRTFHVDPERARRALELVPAGRIAVHMSGIGSGDALRSVSDSRADAVLVGEALMRATEPGTRLRSWLGGA